MRSRAAALPTVVLTAALAAALGATVGGGCTTLVDIGIGAPGATDAASAGAQPAADTEGAASPAAGPGPGSAVGGEAGGAARAAPAAIREVPARPVAIVRKSGFAVAADGTRIYYEAAGSGPAVVFVHGLGGNHAVWFHQFAEFAGTFTSVAMSQRGFAPSGAAPGHYEVATLVSDLVSVLDALGIGRTAVVGQSMGGWTALGMALAHPERVSAVVLADSPAGIFDAAIDKQYAEMVERARKLAGEPPLLARHPALDPAFCRRAPGRAWLYQTLASFGAPSPATIAADLAKARFDPARLAANRVPALFVVGARDPIFPPATIRRAASHLGSSWLAEIPDSGHSPYFERPELWNALVERFLDEHP